MQSEKIAVIALVVIIAGALSAYLLITYGADIFNSPPEIDEDTIAIGDCVDVNYIGRFADNQTIFDTSYESVALSAGIYDENRTYEPLQIFVNPNGNLTKPSNYTNYSASMIKGFLEGLVGTKKGENKTVIIPPEKAYGIWNETLAEEYGPVPNEMVFDIEYDMDRTQFTQMLTYYLPELNISDINVNTTFDFGAMIYNINNTLNATITNVNNTNVTFKALPINGTEFTYSFPKWDTVISVTNDTAFTIKFKPEVGFIDSVSYMGGFLNIKVVGLNETYIKLAMNLEAPDIKFVGQTLEFTLSPIEVYKTSLDEES